MLVASKIRLVLSTCPDRASSERLAKLALEEQLVACVNIIPSTCSIYLWEGELIENLECVLLAKSREENLANLESLWMNNHPYEVPEFLVMNISHSSTEYEKWVKKYCFG